MPAMVSIQSLPNKPDFLYSHSKARGKQDQADPTYIPIQV